MRAALVCLLMLVNPNFPPDPRAEVGALLDRFHAAAARADEAAYFACFAPGAVFLGTDASERWTLEEFRAYAHPVFAKGTGWTYVSEKRSVELAADGNTAWFDEVLRNAKYGLCRGTGVALLRDGGWHVAQYSLTFLVPNERAAGVVAAIAEVPAATPAPKPAHAHDDAHHAHGDAQHAHGDAHHAHGDDATMTHRFDDVERWVSVFDDPERDAWQKPAEVVALLRLEAGDVVADIGAGTGYFEPHLHRAVGETGTVFAVDVEPSLVGHLRERAEKEKLARVVPVLGSFDDPRLPRGVVDLVIVVNTYHHVGGRVDYFKRLHAAFAPGGRLAIVEFTDKPRPVGPPLEHSLSKEQIVSELREAGWKLDADHALLPWQYLLVFRQGTAG